MLRIFFLLLISVSAQAQLHCGYDFTSYLVLHVHEEGSKENIGDLDITLLDASGQEAVNANNRYSWKNTGEVLKFTRNYQIDNSGNRVSDNPQAKWFFPYAQDVWLLSVTNEFPADEMMVRITDPKGRYETLDVQLYSFNMYVLCTSDAQQKAVQFGRRVNKPVDIVLKKK